MASHKYRHIVNNVITNSQNFIHDSDWIVLILDFQNSLTNVISFFYYFANILNYIEVLGFVKAKAVLEFGFFLFSIQKFAGKHGMARCLLTKSMEHLENVWLQQANSYRQE